jgi:AcrR family transcriptional regulator
MPRKTDRRHQQGDQSRQRILEATLDIAAERGYDGTTVSLVTERTGMPASSVYWHFTNKDELLAETLEYSYDQWRGAADVWEISGAGPRAPRRVGRAPA